MYLMDQVPESTMRRKAAIPLHYCSCIKNPFQFFNNHFLKCTEAGLKTLKQSQTSVTRAIPPNTSPLLLNRNRDFYSQ